MAKIEEPDETPGEAAKRATDEALDKAASKISAGGSPGERDLCDPPTVWVLGHMEGNVAIRLGWASGLHVVSNSRFKFLVQDMKLNIIDNEDEYLF